VSLWSLLLQHRGEPAGKQQQQVAAAQGSKAAGAPGNRTARVAGASGACLAGTAIDTVCYCGRQRDHH
jgi:hypothetical protein